MKISIKQISERLCERWNINKITDKNIEQTSLNISNNSLSGQFLKFGNTKK